MPRWLWIVLGGVLLLCLIALVVAAVVLKDSWLPLLRGEAQATPTEEVAPTATPQLTEETTPPTEESTSPPTATPTTEPAVFTVTLQVDPPELTVNQLLTATVTVTNTGQVEISNLRYHLSLEGEGLGSDQPLEFTHPGPLQPGNTDQGEFFLKGRLAGEVSLRACVTVSPRPAICSETIRVVVLP